MFVKPKDGLVIRDPATKQLVPAEGIEVADGDLFWARRLRDGDAEVIEPLAAFPEPAPDTARAQSPVAAMEVPNAEASCDASDGH